MSLVVSLFNSRAGRIGLITGAAYGFIARLVLTFPKSLGISALVMTVGFLFCVPLTIGYLTVRHLPNPTIRFQLFAPWLTCALVVVGSVLVGLEGSICVVLASPVMLVLASIGGIIAASRVGRSRTGIPIALVLPWAVMSFEHGATGPLQFVTTTTQIEIDAPPSIIWPLVVSVDSIRPNERQPALYTTMGFPRPIAATLDRPGLGGVRTASFDRGVVFHEAVIAWEPELRLRFTIDAKDVPPSALDPHVTIGGPFFDVLTGTYELQPLSSTRTLLILRSEHRVSTRFNLYAAWWANQVMSSIQHNILVVLKQRAELRRQATRN